MARRKKISKQWMKYVRSFKKSGGRRKKRRGHKKKTLSYISTL